MYFYPLTTSQNNTNILPKHPHTLPQIHPKHPHRYLGLFLTSKPFQLEVYTFCLAWRIQVRIQKEPNPSDKEIQFVQMLRDATHKMTDMFWQVWGTPIGRCWKVIGKFSRRCWGCVGDTLGRLRMLCWEKFRTCLKGNRPLTAYLKSLHNVLNPMNNQDCY